MKNGYFRVAAVVPPVEPGDIEANVKSILEFIPSLHEQGVEVAVFPEMCITGYTCADLFHDSTLLTAAADGLQHIIDAAEQWHGLSIIVGYPRVDELGAVYNCAALINSQGVTEVRKTYVPEYNEFYERRWWRPAPLTDTITIADINGVKIGIEICEDLWAPIPPSTRLAMAGADVICNLSASDDVIGKYDFLRTLIKQQSSRCLGGYVYASAGFGESSTDLVFDGKAIIAESGGVIAEKERWNNDCRMVIADIDIDALRHDRRHYTTFADCAERELQGYTIDEHIYDLPAADIADSVIRRRINPHPFLPANNAKGAKRCEEMLNIQTAGLARRLSFIHATKLVVGISGGLDSTLALLVAVRTFDRLGLDRKGIIGVTMPGFGTTGRTHANALTLMEQLGVTSREVSIVPAVMQHFADIGHDPAVHDVTYENSQARERTQLLMDIANREGAIVLGTGDLSELALGWATYNGDHMSMYGVNAGIPKTLVSRLVRQVADDTDCEAVRTALLDIIDTPISPELIPADEHGDIAQKTEDLVGPYELHDFYLYQMIRYGHSPRRIYLMAQQAFGDKYDNATIHKWLRIFYRRFFTQQFKRSCLPDGPKVGSICLSPRGDWRMPSDASAHLWLAEIDSISPL